MAVTSSESVAALLATPGLTVGNLTAFILGQVANQAAMAEPEPIMDGRHCSDGLCGCTSNDFMNNLNAACSTINGGAWARLHWLPARL